MLGQECNRSDHLHWSSLIIFRRNKFNGRKCDESSVIIDMNHFNFKMPNNHFDKPFL